MGVDFRELKELKAQLEKEMDNMDLFIEDMAKELAARLLAKSKKRTPVDTGTLRRGWTIGEITHSGGYYKVEVINPVEYASYVEYGHRTAGGKGWVEGQFFLTISEEELKRDAPKIIETKIKKKLGEYFK